MNLNLTPNLADTVLRSKARIKHLVAAIAKENEKDFSKQERVRALTLELTGRRKTLKQFVEE